MILAFPISTWMTKASTFHSSRTSPSKGMSSSRAKTLSARSLRAGEMISSRSFTSWSSASIQIWSGLTTLDPSAINLMRSAATRSWLARANFAETDRSFSIHFASMYSSLISKRSLIMREWNTCWSSRCLISSAFQDKTLIGHWSLASTTNSRMMITHRSHHVISNLRNSAKMKVAMSRTHKHAISMSIKKVLNGTTIPIRTYSHKSRWTSQSCLWIGSRALGNWEICRRSVKARSFRIIKAQCPGVFELPINPRITSISYHKLQIAVEFQFLIISLSFTACLWFKCNKICKDSWYWSSKLTMVNSWTSQL